MNFRRKLKHILKNWQREDMNKPEGYKLIVPMLKELGYIGLPCDIIFVLRFCPNAKSRVLGRIGRAALKQGKYACLATISLVCNAKFDPRIIDFETEEELIEGLYEI